jgi:hypothetical protein
MSPTSDPHAEVREKFIEAFTSGRWDFTKRASIEGPDAFRRHSEHPSLAELVDYILDLLDHQFPLRQVVLHDPPHGEAYEMENTDGHGLYIKLKLDGSYVIVMSFHLSTR